jgi:hypothetical protein
LALSERTRQRVIKLSSASRRIDDAARAARERRDGALAEADAEGGGIREIAKLSELSPAQVNRILGAATAEQQADAIDPHPEEFQQ